MEDVYKILYLLEFLLVSFNLSTFVFMNILYNLLQKYNTNPLHSYAILQVYLCRYISHKITKILNFIYK